MIRLPFPDGHDRLLERPRTFGLRGILTKDMIGHAQFKPIREEDILVIRQILTDEVKRQNKEREEWINDK